VAEQLQEARRQIGAKAILTTDYPLNSWIRFFLPRSIPVEQIDDRVRWSNEPAPDPSLFTNTLMYVCRSPCHKLTKLERRFSGVYLLETIKQDSLARSGAQYKVYRVTGPTQGVLDYRLYGADHEDQ
jgi:hypothetical protein